MEGSRIVFPALEKRSREVWMQSEPRRPQIILSYIGGHVVKSAPRCAHPPFRRAPAIFGRPACMSTRKLFFRALFSSRQFQPTYGIDMTL